MRAETGCHTATDACIGDSDENGHAPKDDRRPGVTGSYNNRLGVSRDSWDGGGSGDKLMEKQQVEAQRAGNGSGS